MTSFDNADYSDDMSSIDDIIDLSEKRAARSHRFPAVEDILDRLTANTSQMAKLAQNG